MLKRSRPMNNGDISPVVSINVDAEEDEEFECTTNVSATIKVNNREVGYLRAHVIDRESGYGFHMPCDAVSQDLQDAGVTFCDNAGHVRIESLHAFKPAVDSGGFLYIDSFNIDAIKLMKLFADSNSDSNSEPSRKKHKAEEEKENDKSATHPHDEAIYRQISYVGAIALRKLLSHPALDGEWQLAVYIPDSNNVDWLDAEAKKMKATLSKKIEVHYRSRLPSQANGSENCRGLAPEEDALLNRLCNESLAGDARPFFRAGFEQVCDDDVVEKATCTFLFAVPTFIEGVRDDEMMSHEKCVDVVIKQKKVRPSEPVGKDLELQNFVAKFIDHGQATNSQLSSVDRARVSSGIDSLLAQGASVDKSAALHFCVANGDFRLIDLLVEKGGKQILDAWDSNGCTPLMVAAGAAVCKKRQGCPLNLDCVKALLRCGADRSRVDVSGKTALGNAWAAQVNMNDFVQCMGLEVDSIECDMKILEAMLIPDGGASKADLAKKNQLKARR